MKKLTNLQELTYRVKKSLQNNVAYRVYSKLESVVYNGDFISTKDFMAQFEKELYKNPESILENLIFIGLQISDEYLEIRDIENEAEFWNMPYEKLSFVGGNTLTNPIDAININVIADKLIYLEWCCTSQSLKITPNHIEAFKKMLKRWGE